MADPARELREDDEERRFWLLASQPVLGRIWDNDEDDVYEQLLTVEERKGIRDRKIDG